MLITGIFPERLKIAKVLLLYKKDDKELLNNYRPISLLPVISKIFERIIYNQLYSYFEINNILYSGQYGFRIKRSTELASLEVIKTIISQMDTNKIPLGIYLDLSKAFDTLDHEILIFKLNYYCIKGLSNKLLRNYLTDRKQFVSFENFNSDLLSIETGVPQGSILGPLLFLMYINDMHLASNLFNFIFFVDDTTSISKNNPKDTHIINNELCKISLWLKLNKLSLNIGKTRAMVFHQPQRNVSIPNLILDNTSVQIVDTFNFLGINLNKNMRWDSHINNISNKISRAIGIINQMKKILSINILLIIYKTLILPHINYCLLCWGYQSDNIFRLQKKNCTNYNTQ